MMYYNTRGYIKCVPAILLFLLPLSIYGQVKIFTTDSINLTEWNYNQRKIIRCPEIAIIAESKNEIFFSYDLASPIKIFNGENASLAVDNYSNIHIVFENDGIRYSSKIATGGWQPDTLISCIGETAHSPVADCDADGNVHILYGISDSGGNGSTELSSLKYVKVFNNQVQISSGIYDIQEEDDPHWIISYTIANHLLFSDGTIFIAYQLSNDSIYLKYSVDQGMSWILGGSFSGTDPKLSIGPGSHWSDPVIEDATFPVLLYLDSQGNLVNGFADFYLTTYDTNFWWMGGTKIQDGPIDYFSIDDVIGPSGYSYIFQKAGVLYHGFSYLWSSIIMDTITDNAITASIAYKQFDRFKVDIVWYEKNNNICELYYQWFEKIPKTPKLTFTPSQSDYVCYGASDGFIQVNVTGGNPPYKYEWSTGDTTQNISNLEPGLYSLIISDSVLPDSPMSAPNRIYAFFEIYESPPVSTGEICGPAETYYYDSATYMVDTTSGSVYQWTVTGGSIIRGQGSNSVTVEWGEPGAGMVSVIETNTHGCKGEVVSKNVSIIAGIDPRGINIFQIFPNPLSGYTTIQFANPESEPYNLSVIDISGHIIKTIDHITTDRIGLNLYGLPSGLYLIELKGPRIYRTKIIIE